MGRLGSNIYYSQGCSGHGVTFTHVAGKVLAEAIRGQAERFDAFAALPHYPFPGGRLLRVAFAALGPWYYQLRDGLGWWLEPPPSMCGHRDVTVVDTTTSIRLRSTTMNHTSAVRRYLSVFMAALFMFTSMVSLHAQASQATMTSTHEVIAEQQLSVDRDQLKAML